MSGADDFAARVREAAGGSVWLPPEAEVTETAHGLVVRYPAWAYTRLLLGRFATAGVDVDAALDVVLEAARTHDDLDEITCEVVLTAPDGYEDALLARGGRLTDTVDVLALDLTGELPPTGPVDPRVRTGWVDDLQTARGFAEVSRAGFGGEPSTDERLTSVGEASRAGVAAGTGGRAIAVLDGRVVAGGGLTMDDGIARLWGAASLPEVRGTGAYRAVLAQRLAFARDHGATLALVKGRVATSGPILRRYGFTAFGEERTYQVPLRG